MALNDYQLLIVNFQLLATRFPRQWNHNAELKLWNHSQTSSQERPEL